MRIAMWSGPRNLSTAMMYAFAQRRDCAVIDEPFYAAYLEGSGARHPMRAEILASQDTDPGRVAAALTGPIPGDRPHYYQKHMVHHMCEGFDLGWAEQMRHVFLIRHPARVVASYAVKSENPGPRDLGFSHQTMLYDRFATAGLAPLVIDSETIRANPDSALRALCAALGLTFDPAMLHWPAGGNPADGIWARHWYGAIHRSTGFAGPEDPLPEPAGAYGSLVDIGMESYLHLHRHRLNVEIT